MVWVKKALLFKGEEKADPPGSLPLAVDELTSNTTEAWAAGLLPAVPRPCMLAYAAAGSRLQFFCLIPSASDSTGKRTGDGSSCSAGSGSRRVRAEPISTVLELRSSEGRLAVVTAAFNIWRLLDDYANSGQLVPAFPIGGQSIKSAGSHVSFHPGYVRKTIPDYRLTHERYVSFELLARLYERLRGPQHRHAIIKASQLPRLDADGTYVVHLAPLGSPCTGPPDTEEELAAAVAGVLRGLAALHAEGYVHRDVRWANVIYLPEDGRWMLIDLEHAGLQGCDCSRSPFPLRCWSPRTLPPDKVYRAASDLRMAAEQLMCGGLRFTLSDAASDLREQLMRAVEADNGGSGGSGLTAEQALKHPWLAAAAAGPWS